MDNISTKLISGYASLADAICARVGKRNISTWCLSLERYFNLPSRSLLTKYIKRQILSRSTNLA